MNRLLLSGKWSLTNGKICVEGHVPGDITNDLYLAGVVQSPYYGENYKDCLWNSRGSACVVPSIVMLCGIPQKTDKKMKKSKKNEEKKRAGVSEIFGADAG